MKINVISYLNPYAHSGGGEMITRAICDYGVELGFDIRILSVKPKKFNEGHSNPDLTIFIDVFNRPHSLRSFGAWRSFSRDFLLGNLEKGPFIHFNNAYVDVCNLPYLPCNGFRSNDICDFKRSLSTTQRMINRDFGNICFSVDSLVKQLFENSVLNVFLSPRHLEVTERILNLNFSNRSFVLRPLIDASVFYNMNLERDIDYLFVGVIGEAKGLSEIRERFSNENIHFAGKIAKDVNLDFGTYHGKLTYDQIPLLMNRAKNFVFLPRWPEPQGRVVVEASMCGCNIIGNENVGALTFPFDLSNPQNYVDVEANFWQTVENLI